MTKSAPKGQRRRRWPRRIAWFVAFLLSAIAILLVSILYISSASEYALKQAITRYSSSVPGSIDYQSIEGSLGNEVCIEELDLRDRTGAHLLYANTLCIGLNVPSLFAKLVKLNTIRGQGVVAHTGIDRNWGDLANPSPPPPPHELPGPNLPIEIEATVDIENFSVVRHEPDGESLLVENVSLSALVNGFQRSLGLQLQQLSGNIPPAQIAIEKGALDLQWESPQLQIASMTVASTAGNIEQLNASLNIQDQHYQASLIANIMNPNGPLDAISPARIELDGGGSWEMATIGLKFQAEDLANTVLLAAVDFSDELKFVSMGLLEPSQAIGVAPSQLVVEGSLREGKPQVRATASINDALVIATIEDQLVQLRSTLPGARVEGSLHLGDEGPRDLEARVEVSSAKEATAALDTILTAEIPSIEGTGTLVGQCPTLQPLRCDISTEAHSADNYVSLDASVEVGKPIIVTLRQLEAEVEKLSVATKRPSEIRIGDDAIQVSDLKLAALDGSIAADGRYAWEGPSHLELDIEDVDLSYIDNFVPQVPLRGRASIHANLNGTADNPQVEVRLTARSLQWQKQALGRLRVDAGYHQDNLKTTIHWQSNGQRADIDTTLPLQLRLNKPFLSLRTPAPFRFDLDLRGLKLSLVNPWIPQHTVRGTIDANVQASGNLRRPTVVTQIRGAKLAVDRIEVGDATIKATMQPGRSQASLHLAGDIARTIDLDLDAPISVDLRNQRVLHKQDAEHSASVHIDRLDLSKLDSVVDGPELKGLVNSQLDIKLGGSEPIAKGSVLARRLRIADYSLGALELKLNSNSTATTVDLTGSGSSARLIELHAEVPLTLPQGAIDRPQWNKSETVIAAIEIRDFNLATLQRQIGGANTVAGNLHAHAYLSGPLHAPVVFAQVSADNLVTRGKALGWTHAEVIVQGKSIEFELEQRRAPAHLQVQGHIPVNIDLSQGEVQWLRNKDHRVSVNMSGFDEQTLGAFVELPRDLHFSTAAKLVAHGTVDSPEAHLRLRGSAQTPGLLPTPISARFDIQKLDQRGRITVGGRGPAGLAVEVQTDAKLSEFINGKGSLSDVTLDARAHATDFQLSELEAFLPYSILHDASGRLNIDAVAQGPVLSPQLEGSLRLNDGTITIVPLNQKFSDATALIKLQGPDLQLVRLAAQSGDGEAKATGKAHIERGNTRGELQFTATKLPVVRPGIPVMSLNTKIDINIDATGQVTKADIDLRDSFIDVLKTSAGDAAQRIPEDDGVIYVDQVGVRTTENEADTAAQSAEKTPWIPQDIELDIEIVEQLRVRGANIDMDWGGHVKVVRNQGSDVVATGSFLTRSGYVAFLSNEFDIVRGEIRMPEGGDLDPYVDLTATAPTPEALVTMEVRGRVSRPVLELKSDPSMPESNIFALLITGHSDAAEAANDDFSAKAASVLVAFQNSALQQQLRERVGVDRVGVGFGDTVEQPIVTVGKRITRDIYVEAEYHHNAPVDENEAEVRLEYQFAPPHWLFETFFGDAAEGGIGVWWQNRFGNSTPLPQNPPKP